MRRYTALRARGKMAGGKRRNGGREYRAAASPRSTSVCRSVQRREKPAAPRALWPGHTAVSPWPTLGCWRTRGCGTVVKHNRLVKSYISPPPPPPPLPLEETVTLSPFPDGSTILQSNNLLAFLPLDPAQSYASHVQCMGRLSRATCQAPRGRKGELSCQVWQNWNLISLAETNDRRRRGGNQSTLRKLLASSFRKCLRQKPENSNPTATWTYTLALVADTC